MSHLLTVKKLSLATISVLTAGALLSGCSLQKTWQDLNQKDEIMQEETTPNPVVTKMAEPDQTEVVSVTPEPTQSTSTEVKDLEADLKVVKFDSETFN